MEISSDKLTVTEAYAKLGELIEKGYGNLLMFSTDNGDLNIFNIIDKIDVGVMVDEDYIVELEEYKRVIENNPEEYSDSSLRTVVYTI